MTTALSALADVLAAQLEHLRRLLPLLEAEQRALQRGDAAALTALEPPKRALVEALTRLEGDRRACLETLAPALGRAGDGVTMSVLARLGPAASAVVAVGRELRETLAAVAQVTRRNASLIDATRACLQRLLDAVRAALAPPATYAAGGQAGRAVAPPRVLDRRA